MVKNLSQQGLLKTKVFQVTIGQEMENEYGNSLEANQKLVIFKTLLLTPNCKLTDAELMSESNVLANPTRKKLTDVSEINEKVKRMRNVKAEHPSQR